MTLASLVACEAIIYRFYSERFRIPFDELSVQVEGDLDLRGGLDIEDVRARVPGDSPGRASEGKREPRDRYEALHEVVARNCPVLDSLRNPVRVSTTLRIG